MGIRTQVLALVQTAPPPPPVTGRAQPWNNVATEQVTEPSVPDLEWADRLGTDDLMREIHQTENTVDAQRREVSVTETYLIGLRKLLADRINGVPGMTAGVKQ
jgi:hypothetical protein